jgi:hypothetical protein
MVVDIHRTALTGQEDIDDQRRSVSAAFPFITE